MSCSIESSTMKYLTRTCRVCPRRSVRPIACVSTERPWVALVPGGSTKRTWLAHCRLVPLALCFELSRRTRGPLAALTSEKAAIAACRAAASPSHRTARTPASANVIARRARHSSKAEKTIARLPASASTTCRCWMIAAGFVPQRSTLSGSTGCTAAEATVAAAAATAVGAAAAERAEREAAGAGRDVTAGPDAAAARGRARRALAGSTHSRLSRTPSHNRGRRVRRASTRRTPALASLSARTPPIGSRRRTAPASHASTALSGWGRALPRVGRTSRKPRSGGPSATSSSATPAGRYRSSP
mmetsp:Transcript_13403/g.43561  ORF Transcript_13403/g.43561 Transcript_13403/m.43561 type:complete len:301 (+) Transcript_13403:612-1514(+)